MSKEIIFNHLVGEGAVAWVREWDKRISAVVHPSFLWGFKWHGQDCWSRKLKSGRWWPYRRKQDAMEAAAKWLKTQEEAND